MSRFWGAGSDSESDDDVELSQEEDSNVESSEEESGEETGFFDRPDSDDEEPDVKRVVRSQRDKRNEAMGNSIRNIKNALKINDWVSIQDEFDVLLKIVQKPTTVMEKVSTPRSFIRCLVHLDDAIESNWGEKNKKKMSALNQKGLSVMKQKLRKCRAQYEADIGTFRQNPVDTDQSEEERANAPEAPEEEEQPEKEAEEEVLTAEDVDGKVAEILGSRGRKNINKKKQLDVLQNLLALAEEPAAKVKVLLTLVSIRLDQSTSSQTYMSAEAWKSVHKDFNQLLDVLENNQQVIVTTEVEDGADENSESLKKFLSQGKKPIAGSLIAIVERLDDEFTKSLQNIDPHTTEYIERLRSESDLYTTIVRTQLYYERLNVGQRDIESIARAISRRVEHIYYKTEAINSVLEKKVHEKVKLPTGQVDSTTLMQNLCAFLYKSSNETIRTRALLCHVFHHALHGRYYKARDLLLMSHLQEMIQNADVSTKILFNRAMVQTGLCAFRHGMLKESQHALQDIHSTGRAKELLAQGIVIQKGVEKTPEQEKQEKQRQIPFHMHINLELLECIFLTCSMILEVPYMASGGHDTRKKIVSKPFRRILDISERQLFTGPPENTREHIMLATKALMSGDWEKSIAMIKGVKIWDLMAEAESIKSMLALKIQRAGLQTYLLSYNSFYDSISLDNLASMFKLSKNDVHGIISKMIVNEDLSASLDQVAGVVVINRSDPSKVQYLALQFTEKAQSLIEINEKILEVRTGNLGGRDDRKQKGDQSHGQQPFKPGFRQPRQGGNPSNQRGGKRQFNPSTRFQRNNQGGNNQGRQRYQNQNQAEGQASRALDA